MPAQRCVDRRRAAESSSTNASSASWTARRRDLVGRELGVERDVAEAAGDEPAVRPLVPVVEAVPAVVRELEQPLRDRLGGDHLAARRDDQPLELAEQAARVAVGRDDDGRRASVSSSDATRVCSRISAPASAARRASRRTSAQAGARRRADGRAPPGSGPRAAAGARRATRRRSRPRERLVLGAQLVALVLVGREPQAARRAGTRRPRASAIALERALGPAPERGAARSRADRLASTGYGARRRGARSRRCGRSRRRRSRAPRAGARAGPPRRARARTSIRDAAADDGDVGGPSSSALRAAARAARRASTRPSTCGRDPRPAAR